MPCLRAVLAQTGLGAGDLEVIVAVNGTKDDTVAKAESLAGEFASKGWAFQVLDIPEPGKLNALNVACAAAATQCQAFLDADVVMDPTLLAEVLAALEGEAPRYATGALRVAPAKSWVSRRYGALWVKLPFMAPGQAAGAGFFAVNAAGRARWDMFPDIIADDLYVRYLFSAEERIEVPSAFTWPLVEGFSALVRVRRRQDAGTEELWRLYPELQANEAKGGMGAADHIRLAVTQPIDYAVYVTIKLAVRLKGTKGGAQGVGWLRGAR